MADIRSLFAPPPAVPPPAAAPGMPAMPGMAPPLPMPLPPPPKFHDVKVVCKRKYVCSKVEPVPPEEFGIARRARSIRDADYCFHEVISTEHDLIAQGFDEDQVKSLPSYAQLSSSEQNKRDTVGESTDRQGDQTLNRAMRPILVTEHYIRMDYDGKGKVCLYRVTTGGEQGEILERDGEPEVVEEDLVRFAAITPIIVTHRFFGRSIADLVMDIQRIKTALLRALLDNAYLANNPRAVVSEDDSSDNTLDDLLVSRPGNIARVKRNAPTAIAWQSIPTIGNHIFPMLEYYDGQKEQRTGVTRQGQGIDADALQNQSATAVQQLYSAAQQRMKLIARIFAETGIKDLFWLLHATIRKSGQQPETVRLRNEWVTVDPRHWKHRSDMTVDVGLGTGGKAQQLAEIMLFANLQEKVAGAGLKNIVTVDNIYNTLKQVTKILELKNYDAYVTDPQGQEPPPPPDPVMQQMQLQAQLNRETAQHKANIDQASATNKAEIEKIQAHADIATNNRKIEAEIAQNEREYNFKRELALLQHQLKEREMLIKAGIEEQKAQAQTAQAAAQTASSDHMGRTNEALSALAQQIADVAAEVQAAPEFITDPQTGRLAGMRKGSRTIMLPPRKPK